MARDLTPSAAKFFRETGPKYPTVSDGELVELWEMAQKNFTIEKKGKYTPKDIVDLSHTFESCHAETQVYRNDDTSFMKAAAVILSGRETNQVGMLPADAQGWVRHLYAAEVYPGQDGGYQLGPRALEALVSLNTSIGGFLVHNYDKGVHASLARSIAAAAAPRKDEWEHLYLFKGATTLYHAFLIESRAYSEKTLPLNIQYAAALTSEFKGEIDVRDLTGYAYALEDYVQRNKVHDEEGIQHGVAVLGAVLDFARIHKLEFSYASLFGRKGEKGAVDLPMEENLSAEEARAKLDSAWKAYTSKNAVTRLFAKAPTLYTMAQSAFSAS
ncbi:MAG: hypothetical protein HGA85_06390 [Nanoarchaeota archaeon]|nr:hypothetical protein [Nanoarchaeota archaeon]